MFREEIKVLDCTIRDGGLINDHRFETRFVREIYKAVAASGADYVEIGYKNSKSILSPDKFGEWKFCENDLLREVVDGIETDAKLSVMVDIGRVDMNDFGPASESPVDMVRVASYVKDIDKAIDLVNRFDEMGYETTVNIMAISAAMDVELDEALHQLESECKAQVIYIVDSFGSLYQETTERLVKKFTGILKSKEVGMHAHNHQQVGFSNTIEAIIHNANYVDGTIYGIGRAAGNCPLELLMGFLKNPKFDIRPILDVISKEMLPMREKIEWGYIIPYAISGMFNEHPKNAMAYRQTDKKDDYVAFYESMSATELD